MDLPVVLTFGLGIILLFLVARLFWVTALGGEADLERSVRRCASLFN